MATKRPDYEYHPSDQRVRRALELIRAQDGKLVSIVENTRDQRVIGNNPIFDKQLWSQLWDGPTDIEAFFRNDLWLAIDRFPRPIKHPTQHVFGYTELHGLTQESSLSAFSDGPLCALKHLNQSAPLSCF